MQIILPKGAEVMYDAGEEASNFLRGLTRTVVMLGYREKNEGFLGGEWGYGVDFENSTFLLHPYCWCEKDTCPWCAGCICPETAFHYFIDEKEVSFDEWIEYYNDRVPGIENSRWEEISREVNTHRTERHDPTCNFCTKAEELTGRIPGYPAPNFWHKPSGFRVWWYKWIGRSMEIYNPNDVSIEKIKKSCFSSLGEKFL